MTTANPDLSAMFDPHRLKNIMPAVKRGWNRRVPALAPGWLGDKPSGGDYTSVVLHRSAADRCRYEFSGRKVRPEMQSIEKEIILC